MALKLVADGLHLSRRVRPYNFVRSLEQSSPHLGSQDGCAPMLAKFIATARKIYNCESGSVAIQLALMMVVILGFLGLGVEITFTLYKHRQLQMIADAAAWSGAVALKAGQDPVIEAKAIAAQDAADNKSGILTVSVEAPKIIKGNHAGQNGVAVTVSQLQNLAIVNLTCNWFGGANCGTGASGLFDVGARAVAVINAVGSYCVLANEVTATGGAAVNLIGCSLAVKSDDLNSITVSGGAIINAKGVTTNGGIALNGGGAINADEINIDSNKTFNDPYSSYPVPAATGSCSQKNYKLNAGKSDEILAPGGCIFTGGIKLLAGSTLTLAPGVYVIEDGGLSVSSGATLNGTDVTIVLSGNNDQEITFNGGSTVKITSPTEGPTAGIAFFGRPSGSSSFEGGANQIITGAVYLPNQEVKYAGGSVTSPTECMELIADTIKFTGNAQFAVNCVGPPIGSTGGNLVNLVE